MARVTATTRQTATQRITTGAQVLSPGGASGTIGQVWALKECNSVASIQAADVSAALAVVGVAGFSLRIWWNSLWQNGAFADSLGLIPAAVAMLQPGQGLMLRVVAGTKTPPDVLIAVNSHMPATPCGKGVTNSGGTVTYTATTLVDSSKPFASSQAGYAVVVGSSYGVVASSDNSTGTLTLTSAGWTGGTPANGTLYTTGLAPTPFHTDGTPNTEFEARYKVMANGLAAAGLATGKMAMLRLPWYGDDFAELNHGATVRAATGYTYANWLTGHERLFDIAYGIAAPLNLAYEHPLTGCGPIQGGGTPASRDLATYMATKDAGLGLAWAQGNGVGIQNYASGSGVDSSASNQGFGMAGNTVIGSNVTPIQGEAAFRIALSTSGLRRAAQMINPGDQTAWDQIFRGVIGYGAQIFEVYTGASFTGAHAAQLAAWIPRYAAAFGARTVASARQAAT